MADVRDASSLHMTVLGDISWREVACNSFDGVTGPSVVRLDATDNVPVSLHVAVALSAVADGRGLSGFFGCDRSSRSGLGCFSPRTNRPATSKRST